MYSVMSGLGTHHEDVASKEDALLLLRYVEDCLLWCFRKGINCQVKNLEEGKKYDF